VLETARAKGVDFEMLEVERLCQLRRRRQCPDAGPALLLVTGELQMADYRLQTGHLGARPHATRRARQALKALRGRLSGPTALI
jgi:hypothetical protein